MTEEQREKWLYHHLYETCEGITEQSERIVALEELVEDMWRHVMGTCALPEACEFFGEFDTRMRELGVEVDG